MMWKSIGQADMTSSWHWLACYGDTALRNPNNQESSTWPSICKASSSHPSRTFPVLVKAYSGPRSFTYSRGPLKSYHPLYRITFSIGRTETASSKNQHAVRKQTFSAYELVLGRLLGEGSGLHCVVQSQQNSNRNHFNLVVGTIPARSQLDTTDQVPPSRLFKATSRFALARVVTKRMPCTRWKNGAQGNYTIAPTP